MAYKDPAKQREYQRRWRERNPDYDKNYRQRTRPEKVAGLSRSSMRTFIKAVKSYPCHDCGSTFPSCAMEFDHLDGSDKVANVSTLINRGNMKQVTAEIMKCDLVCANCHAIRTHGLD